MTNCPNCGAPIVAATCEYCGTIFNESHATTTEKFLANGILTRNEARELCGLNRHKANLEHERLRLENELTEAKMQVVANMNEMKILYEAAIRAMRAYSH